MMTVKEIQRVVLDRYKVDAATAMELATDFFHDPTIKKEKRNIESLNKYLNKYLDDMEKLGSCKIKV